MLKAFLYLFICGSSLSLFAQSSESNDLKTVVDSNVIRYNYPQETEYVSGMKTAIKIMDKGMSVEQLQQAANFFEDMSYRYPSDWLSPYYAAYCYSVMSFMEKIKLLKDKYLDDAQKQVDIAKRLSPNNSEILAVQAYIYQLRVEVNPEQRVEEFGTMSELTFKQALSVEPDNPRVYYLRAQNAFFSPQISREAACEIVIEAQGKYAVFSPANELAPKWGEAMVDFMSQTCQKMFARQSTQPPANTTPEGTMPTNTNKEQQDK